MSKVNLADKTWALAALMDGKDRQHCLALTDFTGFRWICNRVDGADGKRETVYVVQNGPSTKTAHAVIDILNQVYYQGQPAFFMSEGDKPTMSIAKKSFTDLDINPDVNPTEAYSMICRIVECCETAALIARASAAVGIKPALAG